ncbi:MAG: hypothetical protein L0Y54_22215 [Sporichthyaceae bacterium]|nr:hypothetical protein [Sporichthyaceae bacterium]
MRSIRLRHLALPLSVVLQPNPAPEAPPGLEALGSDLIAWTKWAALIAGVVGLIVCGIMMIIGRRNRSGLAVEGAIGIAWAISGLLVVGAAGLLVSGLL